MCWACHWRRTSWFYPVHDIIYESDENCHGELYFSHKKTEEYNNNSSNKTRTKTSHNLVPTSSLAEFLRSEYQVVVAPAAAADGGDGGDRLSVARPQETEEDREEDEAVVETEYDSQWEDLTQVDI